MNAYGIISLVRLIAASALSCHLCGSFLPVLNPVVVISGLRAGTCCAVLHGSLLIVSKCVCHLCNKEILFTLLFYFPVLYILFVRIRYRLTKRIINDIALNI